MRPRVLAVGPDRRYCGTLRHGRSGGRILPTHARTERMADRKHSERLGIIRIDRDGLLEQPLSHEIVLAGHAPVMRQRAHHQVPGVKVLRRFAAAAKIFRRVKLRLNRGNDGLGDLVLYREHIGQLAVVTLRPEMAAGGDVVELHGDPHPAAILAHAALDDIADTEVFGDLFQVYGFALVGERGVARDHEEPAQLREPGDDVLADAVGKIILLDLAAHVDEGKHGDRGSVGGRQGRACGRGEDIQRRRGGRLRLIVLLPGLYVGDESDAFAGDGAYSDSVPHRCRRSPCARH